MQNYVVRKWVSDCQVPGIQEEAHGGSFWGNVSFHIMVLVTVPWLHTGQNSPNCTLKTGEFYSI